MTIEDLVAALDKAAFAAYGGGHIEECDDVDAEGGDDCICGYRRAQALLDGHERGEG